MDKVTKYINVKIPEYLLPMLEETLEECMEFAFNDWDETKEEDAKDRYDGFCELQSAIARFSRGPNAMTYTPVSKQELLDLTKPQEKAASRETTWCTDF